MRGLSIFELKECHHVHFFIIAYGILQLFTDILSSTGTKYQVKDNYKLQPFSFFEFQLLLVTSPLENVQIYFLFQILHEFFDKSSKIGFFFQTHSNYVKFWCLKSHLIHFMYYQSTAFWKKEQNLESPCFL